MSLVVYNDYWNTYSRLLAADKGIRIEINLTPVRSKPTQWKSVAQQHIRIHLTPPSKGDKTMGINFMPESIILLMKENLGEALTKKLSEFNYLDKMMRIFRTRDIECLYGNLAAMRDDGGTKWGDILSTEQDALSDEIEANKILVDGVK